MTDATEPIVSEGLARLVRAIADVLGPRAEEGVFPSVSQQLLGPMADSMADPELLPEALMTPPISGYAKYLLHAEPSFVLFASVSAAGFPLPVHDHGGPGLVALYRGIEQEITYSPSPAADGPGLRERSRSSKGPGSVMAVLPPPDDIHQVITPGPGPTVAVHLFGHDLVTTGFRIYPPPDYRPVPTGPLSYDRLPAGVGR